VSKAIVQEAFYHYADTIVFEQINHIRGRMQNGNQHTQRQMHTWSFRRLQTFVTYKATEAGIRMA
jgi:IS605 OrfB family transposase